MNESNGVFKMDMVEKVAKIGTAFDYVSKELEAAREDLAQINVTQQKQSELIVQADGRLAKIEETLDEVADKAKSLADKVTSNTQNIALVLADRKKNSKSIDRYISIAAIVIAAIALIVSKLP